MVQRRIYFLVGLFVIIGLLLGAAAVIWLGASKYFQKGSIYVTYFDESVQGLQVDSIVKFRGVDIGTVRKIGVAPDQRLVEVVMKIDVKDFNVKGVVAKLTLAGITGIVYVELDRRKQGEQAVRPTTFQPPYPVIPSVPSDIKQIESAISDIMDRIKQIDFNAIAREITKAAASLDSFVKSDQVKQIMRDAGTATAKLADAAQKMDNFLSGGSLDEAVATAREAVKEAKAVMERARVEIERADIGKTAARVDRLVEGTSARVDSALTEVEITVETLRRTAESVEELADRLKADPSALIFSRPPKGE
jgi:phospholipid/cholesterol/gamma-HCH transport system substrate-binding protein